MWGTLWGYLGIGAGSFCALALSGCVGATRLPERTNGPTGATIQKDDIDLAFLQVGTTRREEVVSKLNRINTGYSSPRMFWGRWSGSKWGHWVVLAGPGGAGGNAERNWHVHNLLVGFDENGVVESKDLVDGERDLERELRLQLAKAPPLDLSQPVRIMLTPYGHDAIGQDPHGSPKEMTLTKDAMLIVRSSTADISPPTVTRISYERFYGNSRSDSICHSLHLSEKTRLGKRIMSCTSAANMATILKYLQQTGSRGIRWE